MTEMTENQYREQRILNMNKLKELGFKPFGDAFKRTENLKQLKTQFREGLNVSAAGRIVALRHMGKSMFAHIADGTEKFQIYAQVNMLPENLFEGLKYLDIGDHIGVHGSLFVTRTGEPTVKVEKWTLLSKALLPLPEKWHGLKDVEARYRQRYLDLIANPQVRDVFNKRIQIISEIRSFLAQRGFQEVETPMMQPQAGGATAKPFVTKYNALNCDMYMRIAPELYLKRLLVGGFDKVFEINRNFRNEGLSRTHNPEFTMLEIYEAYGDVNSMKELIQSLIINAAEKVCGTLKVGKEGNMVDLTPPWREATYKELVLEKMGADWYDLPKEEARKRLESMGVTSDPSWDMLMITHEAYEKIVEKSLKAPTFVRRIPAQMIPLAKRCEDDPTVIDVFELVIDGKEVAPAYSELNDPVQQRKSFMEQVQEDAEKIDEEFITALEHGMPPAGGMGVGIDRLVMILTGEEAIRDVILFPQLKHKE